MPHKTRTQLYMYAVMMPDDGRPVWGPGLDGRRARQFAEAVELPLLRWPVQRWVKYSEGGVDVWGWSDTE